MRRRGRRSRRGYAALLFTLALAAAFAVGCATEPGTAPSDREAGVVARVGDGDSLELEDGRRIRLLGIDAPELGEGECYAEEALRELETLLVPGTRVELEADPALDDVDRYDRLLRYVIADRRNVNLELVRRGAAAPYVHEGEPGRYADDLLGAADGARAGGRGLWGACTVDWRPDRQLDTFDRG